MTKNYVNEILQLILLKFELMDPRNEMIRQIQRSYEYMKKKKNVYVIK